MQSSSKARGRLKRIVIFWGENRSALLFGACMQKWTLQFHKECECHSTKSHISEVAQICLKSAFVSVCVSPLRGEGMVLQHLLLLLYPEKVLSSRCSYHRRYRKPIRHHATKEERLLLLVFYLGGRWAKMLVVVSKVREKSWWNKRHLAIISRP